ncbi:MAG: type II toxin-antitoxin system VapC family toxin [Thermoleophilia bacterium]|nr:type II toxin-antitoxin system VapC family toxin [Thermoleophilia bacterium]
MIVVDASVLLFAVAYSGGIFDRATERLNEETSAAPHLIDLETTNALKRLERLKVLDPEAAQSAVADVFLMPVLRYDHRPLLARSWELRRNLSIYDASYVALAELLDAPLVTADSAFTKAPGIRCEVELLTP